MHGARSVCKPIWSALARHEAAVFRRDDRGTVRVAIGDLAAGLPDTMLRECEHETCAGGHERSGWKERKPPRPLRSIDLAFECRLGIDGDAARFAPRFVCVYIDQIGLGEYAVGARVRDDLVPRRSALVVERVTALAAAQLDEPREEVLALGVEGVNAAQRQPLQRFLRPARSQSPSPNCARLAPADRGRREVRHRSSMRSSQRLRQPSWHIPTRAYGAAPIRRIAKRSPSRSPGHRNDGMEQSACRSSRDREYLRAQCIERCHPSARSRRACTFRPLGVPLLAPI